MQGRQCPEPLVMRLAAGTHLWCSCGQSENFPFCDGKHEGTGKRPVRFELPNDRRVAVCQCGQSKRAPVCDGAHVQLLP